MTRLPSVTSLLLLVLVVSTAAAPARAASVTFEGLPGEAVTWKPVAGPTGAGTSGYWDRTSYDSAGLAGPAACAAAMLVAGMPCDWVPRASSPISAPGTATGTAPLEYLGLTMPAANMPDAPGDFYFTGSFDMDWRVLFQLTAWADAVEFGWYEAGNPEARTPLAGPGGPFTANDGGAGRAGTLTLPDRAFGFYYRNARFSGDVLFFTQSRFNRAGGYVQYFGEQQFVRTDPHFDDERVFEEVVTYSLAQQFILLRQGSRYWLGLEDQVGRVSPVYCAQVGLQPCADYDFNDLLVAFTERDTPVPEPGLLALLAAGAGVALARRARRRR